ncbi:serine/threonine-protein phosphatase 6 regulatory ankyrin repeat subunit B-like [Pyrus ussuriensis x Pyrus communis]|uniref:Serine/threonine-protein phosphatase 6 regulatory ankyrin repeat subunit B-like n=1 Tax=Pyrus ussuriensis x Pyrus communis TaxID=2448454 RepID=A0A5N5HB60_9ROSA|nr:serine/threonine-protein phosphatase 6 regulatory ankyrin repeat subunit B-like [Pyrus ussuriensis x Pyrus communis]
MIDWCRVQYQLSDKIWTNCTNDLCWSARYKHQECLQNLASDGADFGLVNSAGQSARVIAESARGSLGFRQAVVDVIRSGEIVQSSNTSVFSPLMLVTQANGVEALKKLIEGADIDHNEQDEKGYSAAMIAAEGGYLETFKLLIDAGADINLQNKRGQTLMELFDTNQNCEEFESCCLRMLHLKSSKRRPLCEPLISLGAKCDIANARHETALLLARKSRIHKKS